MAQFRITPEEKPRIAVCAVDPSTLTTAQSLSLRLSLPLVDTARHSGLDYVLSCTCERLELHATGRGAAGPVYAEFAHGPMGYRIAHHEHQQQPLARAVGLKPGALPKVIDATAGLGRDAVMLATLGCEVLLLERSPIVAALVRDGLNRAARTPQLAAVVNQRLRLLETEAITYLQRLAGTERAQVIYLDPMHPHRTKSALVKKEMRVLRAIVGDDDDANELFRAALDCTTQRVVVKRARLAPQLEGPPPTSSIPGRQTRFDIYVMASTKARLSQASSAPMTSCPEERK